MKKFNFLSALLLSTSLSFAQNLTEVTNVSLFEHHFSGCDSCAPSDLGDSSAYDFVTHQHINAIGPNSFDENRDMVEHNGDPFGPAPFGFTSDSSSVWANQFGGNGTTKYILASGFDYANATQESIVNAYDDATATPWVAAVQAGEVYIAKIRNLEYYVVLSITATQTLTDNDFTFDYKYTDNPIVPVTPNGIREDALGTSRRVYPNPVNDVVNLPLDKNYSDIRISITNMLGAQVWAENFTDRDLVQLNLGSLPGGVYMMVAQTDGAISYSQFVKED